MEHHYSPSYPIDTGETPYISQHNLLLGSIIVSFPQSLETLQVGKGFKGLEAVISVIAVIIIDEYFDETRVIMMGAFGVTCLIYILDPAISGFFAGINWHYVFMIKIPVALIVVIFKVDPEIEFRINDFKPSKKLFRSPTF